MSKSAFISDEDAALLVFRSNYVCLIGQEYSYILFSNKDQFIFLVSKWIFGEEPY